MVEVFIFLSIISTFFCYLNIDPIKSCLFLVISLIFIRPLISLGKQVWFSYFVCLIFLSGIFVILVYFSSLSKYNFYNFSFGLIIFLGVFIIPIFYFVLLENSLVGIFFLDYIIKLVWIVVSLIFFITFTRYFLNFSGALRKF